jgi:bifunctional ADP-heptose synthase (sugar kinase/adenylyltransferase)
MDTRTKILTAQQAAAAARRLQEAGRKVCVVTGYFDPLLAAHARRLAACRSQADVLMAVVCSPERPILSARARAELVAALAVVDYVVLAEDGLVEALQGAGVSVERHEHLDEQITRELIAHVQRRHHGT